MSSRASRLVCRGRRYLIDRRGNARREADLLPVTASTQFPWLARLAILLLLAVFPLDAAAQARERSGREVVESTCFACHGTGAQGAPRVGERDAWIQRLRQGLDSAVHSAIRGHGGMPPRGGEAKLTDAEVRSAIVYMFGVPGAAQPAQGASTPPATTSAKVDAKHASAGGIEIFLGLVPAESLRAFPPDSTERTMHGGVPGGTGHLHVNVSLLDATSLAAIHDARVNVRIEQRGGVSVVTKSLEPMSIHNTPSFGNYVRMGGKATYLITVQVQRPGSSAPIEARFEHRVY